MKNQKPRPVRGIATVRRAYIEKRIYFVRSQRVIVDTDLATLYRVPTKVFNQAVRRNMLRFPGGLHVSTYFG